MGAEQMVVGANEDRWGTWEELILGGAVLRHGTQDWNVVASELRARVLSPYYFTPEVCRFKYEDLRKRYSGCNAWFEELRKRRVAELKRELEKSKDSIGSLESKIKRLKADSGYSYQVHHESSLAESPAPIIKLEDIDSVGREMSKDGLSAGSFTQNDTQTNCAYECQIPPAASTAETDIKPEISTSPEQEKGASIGKPVQDDKQGVTIRKRRGKRKRKDCDKDAKEGSIGDSDNLGSTNAISASRLKETSASECNQTLVSSRTDNHGIDSCRVRSDDLMGIYISIAQHELASVFRHRLDSQKRARYKKVIRHHLDFGIIRSRIDDRSIKSAGELFRDLLLLANNAMVFYSKRTREYKSAFSLRDVVMKAYRKHCQATNNKTTSATSLFLSFSPLCHPPGKPRSARPRPCKGKLSEKLSSAKTDETQQENEKSTDIDVNIPLQSLLMAKKSLKRPEKVKRESADGSPLKTPSNKRKKRAQQI